MMVHKRASKDGRDQDSGSTCKNQKARPRPQRASGQAGASGLTSFAAKNFPADRRTLKINQGGDSNTPKTDITFLSSIEVEKQRRPSPRGRLGSAAREARGEKRQMTSRAT